MKKQDITGTITIKVDTSKYGKVKSIKQIPNDSIVESVIKQFKERSEVGIKKYGTTLDRNDLNFLEWLQHLQEELFDATLYLEKLKQEWKQNDASDVTK